MPDNQPPRTSKRTFRSVPGRVVLAVAIHAAALATRIDRKLDWLSPLLKRVDSWWHSVPAPNRPSRADRYQYRLNQVRSIASMLWVVRASWTIAPLLAILIIIPDQTVDAMQCLSETDWSAMWWFTLLCTFACMGFAGLTLWHWGRAAVDLFAQDHACVCVNTGHSAPLHDATSRGDASDQSPTCSLGHCRCAGCRGRHWAGLLLPRAAGLVPSIAFTLCAARALMRAPSDGTAWWMLVFLIAAGVASMALQWYCYVLRRQILEHRTSEPARPAPPTRSLRAIDAMSRMFLGAWLLIGLLLTAGFMYVPGFAAAFGPIAILYVSAALCVSAGGLLVWVDEHIGIPTLPILTLFAAAFSAANLNDNHQIRAIAPPARTAPPQPAPPRLTAASAFDAWLKARPDHRSASRVPPVILMCAEGGGIYAATLTGMTLAHLESITPGGITPSIFCISAVSGGSVGAATFASLMQAQRTSLQPGNGASSALEASVERALSNDLLSPVLAHLLFPDLIQRFLPVPIRSFDRARALEHALEHAVAAELGGEDVNPMAGNITDLWSPSGRLPALLLNTTRVDTGERIVISPFDIAPAATASLLTFSQLAPHLELRTSTAAVASARFSFVTPAATIDDIRPTASSPSPATTTRLVDGGYFDNPGATTLLDVLNAILTRRPGQQPLRVLVVRIGIAPAPGDTLNFTGLGETLSPVRAMFNTRPAHGRTSVAQLIDALTHVDPSIARTGYVELILDTQAQKIPLGWLLSTRSRSAILSQFGISSGAATSAPAPAPAAAARNREILAAISAFAQTGEFPPSHLDATYTSQSAPAQAR